MTKLFVVSRWSLSIVREKMSSNLAEPENKSIGQATDSGGRLVVLRDEEWEKRKTVESSVTAKTVDFQKTWICGSPGSSTLMLIQLDS